MDTIESPLKRRKFFKLGLVGMTSLAIAPLSLSKRPMILLDNDFVPLLGSTFKFDNAESSFKARLVDVKVDKHPLPAGLPRQRSFSLLFEVDGNAKEQGVYALEHRELDSVECLTVPSNKQGNQFAVCFG